jgi:hypothetical protein
MPASFTSMDSEPQNRAKGNPSRFNALENRSRAHFVVVYKPEGYFYFCRIAEERLGWGANPEVIIGPLSKERFAAMKAELGLPDPNITP